METKNIILYVVMGLAVLSFVASFFVSADAKVLNIGLRPSIMLTSGFVAFVCVGVLIYWHLMKNKM
jgi:high-affinity Fe2+/Pb2+ permease